MAWIESHTALEGHPKLYDLAARSGLDIDACIGRLHRLWWWCLIYAQDGDIGRFTSAQIPAIHTDEFREHLRATRWLDGDLIHDWIDYAGLFLTRKYSSGNIPLLKEIWLKHGYKYGKGQGKYTKQKANSKRIKGEQKAKLPNLTRPNLTRPNLTNQTKEEEREERDVVVTIRESSRPLSDEEWVNGLKLNATYSGLDLDRELGKCRAWCEANRKAFGRRRFVNWINRAERPMQAQGESPFMRGMNDFLQRHRGEE